MSLNKPIYHMAIRVHHLAPAIAICIDKSTHIRNYYDELISNSNNYINKLQQYYNSNFKK